MSFRFNTASTFLLLLFAALAACSKKDNQVTTYVLDKTTSTTGSYEGTVHVENGLATQGTAPVIANCHPGINTLVPTDENIEPSMKFYPLYTTSSYQVSAGGNSGTIYISFYQNLPVNDYLYTTSYSPTKPQEISILLKTNDGETWTANGGQKIFVNTIDPALKGFSITLCSINFTSYTTSSVLHLTADGNFHYN
jgi:hypothetical protein